MERWREQFVLVTVGDEMDCRRCREGERGMDQWCAMAFHTQVHGHTCLTNPCLFQMNQLCLVMKGASPESELVRRDGTLGWLDRADSR